MSGELGFAQGQHTLGDGVAEQAPWRLLVVAAESAVHSAAAAALGTLCHAGRSVALLSAHDLAEARQQLTEDNIAVVLVDGVARDALGPTTARILAYAAPEPTEVLRTAVDQALESYREIAALTAANRQLERMLADRSRDLEEANLILDRLATTDPLTGIVNRRRFMDLASREVLRSKRSSAAISVILLDIDHLRQVNDQYGQATGDAVLLEVVNRIGLGLRTLDVLGRLGGEEFAILLPDAHLEGASVVAERLRDSIAATPMYAGDGRMTVTASLGVATLSSDETLDGLLHRADEALGTAKRDGRNRVVVAGMTPPC